MIEQLSPDTDSEREAQKGHVIELMGEVIVHETSETVTEIPELSAERQVFMVERDPNTTYLFVCGDDRPLTPESAAYIEEQYSVSGEEMIRYYGALTGAARILAVSIAAQSGAEALSRYGSDFTNFTLEVKHRLEANNKVLAGEHSAEANEGNSKVLNPDSDKGLGCAYCGGVGAVTCMCSGSIEDGGAMDIARVEQTSLLGNDMSGLIRSANQDVEQLFFAEDGPSASVGRSELGKLETPVAILAGSHAKASDVEVCLNFDPNRISNPRGATEAGSAFYNNDMTIVTEMLMKAFPELNLKPEIVLAAGIYDVAAVREALASHESKHASDMKLVRYGDPAAALEYLNSL